MFSVSEKVKETFNEIDSVVFELELQNHEIIETLLRCKNLDGGLTLKEILSVDVYERLKSCE